MKVLLRSPFNEAREERGWNTEAVLRDYRIACRSRQCTIVGRREVYSGKAKFGIFGDGKESAQLALAYAFRKGDFRSGYYRDQTLMFALDLLTVEQFFAQLYAHADVSAEPGFRRAFHDRSLRHTPARRRWELSYNHGPLQLRRGFISNCDRKCPSWSGLRMRRSSTAVCRN